MQGRERETDVRSRSVEGVNIETRTHTYMAMCKTDS